MAIRADRGARDAERRAAGAESGHCVSGSRPKAASSLLASGSITGLERARCGRDPHDGLTYGAVIALVVAAAAYVPARSAASIDPAVLFRAE
jgi:hypothetical protein